MVFPELVGFSKKCIKKFQEFRLILGYFQPPELPFKILNFQGKSTPYEFDIKIPFYVRGPDIRRRTNRDRQKPNPIVLNIDIAPTLLGFAGITPPAHMDGLNMAGVLRGFFTETRDTFLIEKKPRPVADKSLKDENQQRASELIDKECQQNPRKYKARRSRGSNKTNPECSNDQVCHY